MKIVSIGKSQSLQPTASPVFKGGLAPKLPTILPISPRAPSMSAPPLSRGPPMQMDSFSMNFAMSGPPPPPSPSYSSPPPPAMQMAPMKQSAAPSRDVSMQKEKAERQRSNSPPSMSAPPPAKPSHSSSLSLAPESLKSGGESADVTSLPSDARSLLTSQEFGGNWTIENVVS